MRGVEQLQPGGHAGAVQGGRHGGERVPVLGPPRPRPATPPRLVVVLGRVRGRHPRVRVTTHLRPKIFHNIKIFLCSAVCSQDLVRVEGVEVGEVEGQGGRGRHVLARARQPRPRPAGGGRAQLLEDGGRHHALQS